MKLSSFIIALTLLTGNATAARALNSDAGTRGAAFLRISPSARASGSAGSFTAVTGESICMDYNPAGIATVICPQFSGTYANWFAGTKYGNASIAWPAGKQGAFGVSYTSLDYGSLSHVSGQDVYGVPIEDGSFSANDMNLALAYAKTFRFGGVPVLLGAALKTVRLAIAGESSAGYGSDVGADVILGRTTLGVAIRNMGKTGVMENRAEQLPQECALGLSREADYGIHSLLMTLDGVKPIDNNIRYRVGMEYAYRTMLFVRMGYRANYDTDGMTAGGGFAYQNMRIDYAYAPFAVLGATHRMSFSLFFTDGFLRVKPKLKTKVKTEPAGMNEKTSAEIAPVLSASFVTPKPPVVPTVPANIVDTIKALKLYERDINFDAGSSEIHKENITLLEDIVRTLKRYPWCRIRIEGHTDSSGNPAENWGLSQARAENVKQYLIRKGIPAGYLIARGFGGTRPVSDNAIEQGRRFNRRVQCIFVTPEGKEIH